jgi:hypothetical protein
MAPGLTLRQQVRLPGTEQRQVPGPKTSRSAKRTRSSDPVCSRGGQRTGPSAKIKRFDCYREGPVILTQLGVIGDLGAAFGH